MSTETKKYKLVRDGDRAVYFTGVELADCTNHSHEGPNQNRWTEVRIYRTQAGRYIVKILGRTQWQGESDRHNVVIAGTPAGILEAMREHWDGYLPRVAVVAIEEAAGNDAAFAEVEAEDVE